VKDKLGSDGGEVLMTDLRIGDRFTFDGHVYTVAEPPQSIWGVVELWVEELDWPLQGAESSTVSMDGRIVDGHAISSAPEAGSERDL